MKTHNKIPEKNFCSNCGKALDSDDRFCTNCGSEIFNEITRYIIMSSLGNSFISMKCFLSLILEGEYGKLSPELKTTIKKVYELNEKSLKMRDYYFNRKIEKERNDSEKKQSKKIKKIRKNGCRVMLFEDDLLIGEMYEKKFISSGFNFKRFTFPSQNVLKDIENFNPDIILTNITMPEMDGYELIKKIRKGKKFNSIILVVFTNIGSQESITKALGLGANEYWICSQHTPDQVVEKTKKILGVE